MQKRWTSAFATTMGRTDILFGKGFTALMAVAMPLIMIALSCGGQDEPTAPPDDDVTLTLNMAKLEPIPANQPFSFIVYGDSKDNISVHKRLIDAFFREKASHDVAFIVNSGDLVHDGNDRRGWKDQFIDVIQPLAEKAPYFVAIGNHDYGTQGECENFAEVFSMYYKNCDFWYDFVYGNSIFIILDANLMAHDIAVYFLKEQAERQYYWLEKVLKSASNDAQIKHKFIFFHEAPFISAGKLALGTVTYHLDHAEMLRKYKIGDNFFLDILREYDVDAVFLGHVHYYERWVEQYERDDNQRRITWVTSGGGGAKNEIEWQGIPLVLRPPTVLTEEERLERIHPYNERAQNAEDIKNWLLLQGYPTQQPETARALEKHYCLVHVDGDSVSMEVKNTEWDVIESAIIKENGKPAKLTFVKVGGTVDVKRKRKGAMLQTGIAGELKIAK